MKNKTTNLYLEALCTTDCELLSSSFVNTPALVLLNLAQSKYEALEQNRKQPITTSDNTHPCLLSRQCQRTLHSLLSLLLSWTLFLTLL